MTAEIHQWSLHSLTSITNTPLSGWLLHPSTKINISTVVKWSVIWKLICIQKSTN